MNPKDYITAAEAAAQQGVDKSRILSLLRQDRIPGALFMLGVWAVPKNFTITPGSRGPALRTKRKGKRK